MKLRSIVLSVAILLIAIFAIRSIDITPSTVPASKVDQRILRAQQSISKFPNSAGGYNQLASAYMQKARETADFSFNDNADAAITRSLAVEPDNYDGLKLRTKLQLTYHRFAEALETARHSQTVRDDDHDVWGQITDALVELGDYPGAVSAAQKMVDLRPDTSSYSRVSYLRSLHGDTQGAIEAMIAAVKAANPNDPESIAWCRVQLGNELMDAGKLEEAEREFDTALQIFPNHSLALQSKARARVAAGDLHTAIAIYEREPDSADASQALGDLFSRLGKIDAAKAAYEKFETLERENAAIEKSWRHMVNFWLDHDQNLEQALKLASDEYNSRKDIFTCDSYAWALFKNGRIAEAKKVIKEALRTGTKDQRINEHAQKINQSST
ncbi:MAG TPA: tetratricopeptide repeat protein [Pyrinomonadaceae bacterium]|nr:tetratricopeptide repeat protein [Pyrinomonadaceae bacterium]